MRVSKRTPHSDQAKGAARELLHQQLLNRLNDLFRLARFLQKIQAFPEDKTGSVQVQGVATGVDHLEIRLARFQSLPQLPAPTPIRTYPLITHEIQLSPPLPPPP